MEPEENLAPEVVARRLVVAHITLEVDLAGHIKFHGTGRVDAVREYQRIVGCDARTARAAIEAACTHLFGVGLIEFIARLSFGAGVHAQKVKAEQEATPTIDKPLNLPLKLPQQPKMPSPSPMLNGYDTCYLDAPHEPHIWRNPDATEAVCDGEGTVTVDRLKTPTVRNDGTGVFPKAADDECIEHKPHDSHYWEIGSVRYSCDGKGNVTTSGIVRAAVMPGANPIISKLRRTDLRVLQSIALKCGMSKAAIVGMTSDELAHDIYEYSRQHPHVAIGI